MAKQRRQIQNGLLHNSAAAYYAAIELHNKPNMPYRYQTTVLLMVNAWELLLKAYLRKYTKTKVEKKDGSTIEFGKTVDSVLHSLSGKEYKLFSPIAENLQLLGRFRNNYAHYCGSDIEPIILGLLAKASIAYLEFRRKYFPKSKFIDSSLYILPLGFSLPFHPEMVFNPKSANARFSDEAADFINTVAITAKHLEDEGIEESVLVGFDVALTSVKQISNADIIATIKEGGIPFTKESRVRIVNNPEATPVTLTDDEFYEQYPLSYQDLTDLCRKSIPTFKVNSIYHKIRKNNIVTDPRYCGHRSLDREGKNLRQYYTRSAVNKIAELWPGTSSD
jgi:hypothetical protein